MLSWIRGTGWTLGFNDPSLPGWITTAGYFLAAAIGLHLARKARREGSLHRQFWFVLSAALVVLGLNKQLDLQTLVLKAGSRIASGPDGTGRKRSVGFALAIGRLAAAWLIASGVAHAALALSACRSSRLTPG